MGAPEGTEGGASSSAYRYWVIAGCGCPAHMKAPVPSGEKENGKPIILELGQRIVALGSFELQLKLRPKLESGMAG